MSKTRYKKIATIDIDQDVKQFERLAELFEQAGFNVVLCADDIEDMYNFELIEEIK